jgi:hypothetical protein
MFWPKVHSIRLLFMAAEAADFDIESAFWPDVVEFLLNMLSGVPDTKVVEDNHQCLRDLCRLNRNSVVSRINRHLGCIESKVLGRRQMSPVTISEDELAASAWGSFGSRSVASVTDPRSVQLPQEAQQLMNPKHPKSVQPGNMYQGACATHWVLEEWSGMEPLKVAHASAKVPLHAMLVLGDKYMFTVLIAELGCLTWPLVAMGRGHWQWLA